MVTREEEQLAKRILEAEDWDMRAAIIRVQKALWTVVLHRFKWNVRQAMKATKFNRTHGYKLLARLDIRRPQKPRRHGVLIMRWPVAKISRDNRV